MTGPDPSSPVLVHFYRALVGHMDVWRQRMDATTNWAAATTAALVTFSFCAPASPHFVLLLAIGFNTTFLLMESRRYQIFDLWRRRFRALNQYYIAPALTGQPMDDARVAAALQGVADDLGRLVPHLPITKALALGAPSEQMMNWADVPAPFVRWRRAWSRSLWRSPPRT